MVVIDNTFRRGIVAEFERINATSKAEEVETKCREVVENQATGIAVIKAGKIFHEVFKKAVDPKFKLKFGKNTTTLPGYYRAALMKDCGTLSHWFQGCVDGEYPITIFTQIEFIAFINAIYAEVRPAGLEIDKVRMLEIANYLDAEAFLIKLLENLERSVSFLYFVDKLLLNKRILLSPIHSHPRLIIFFRSLGACLGREIVRATSVESSKNLIEKCSENNVVSLNFNFGINNPNDEMFSFLVGSALIEEIKKITTLTELAIPNSHRVLSSDLQHLPTRLVSLSLNVNNCISLTDFFLGLTALKLFKAKNIDGTLDFSCYTKLRRLKLVQFDYHLKFPPYLQKLSLNGEAYTRNIPIELIPETLTSLSLRSIRIADQKYLSTTLNKLKLIYVEIAEMNFIERFETPRLTDLSLSGNWVCEYDLQTLPRTLTRLEISTSKVTNKAFFTLTNLRQLDLNCEGTCIQEEVFELLPKSLNHVHFRRVSTNSKSYRWSHPANCEVVIDYI